MNILELPLRFIVDFLMLLFAAGIFHTFHNVHSNILLNHYRKFCFHIIKYALNFPAICLFSSVRNDRTFKSIIPVELTFRNEPCELILISNIQILILNFQSKYFQINRFCKIVTYYIFLPRSSFYTV